MRSEARSSDLRPTASLSLEGPNRSRFDGSTRPTSGVAAGARVSSALGARAYAEGPATAGDTFSSNGIAGRESTRTSLLETSSPQLQHAPAIAGNSIPHREHFTRRDPIGRTTSLAMNASPAVRPILARPRPPSRLATSTRGQANGASSLFKGRGKTAECKKPRRWSTAPSRHTSSSPSPSRETSIECQQQRPHTSRCTRHEPSQCHMLGDSLSAAFRSVGMKRFSARRSSSGAFA